MSGLVQRKVQKVFGGEPVIEGAGVHLRRVFGFHGVERFDPFLMLDDFRSDVPEKYLKGFPWHPHRGIETITYVLKGVVEHGDSLGNAGIISSGDVQWMTAGSGIIHQEMPKGDGKGAMYGFQLWANLPAEKKMMDPRYRDIGAADIPTVTLDGGVIVRVIAGSLADVSGPVDDVVIEPEFFDCDVPAGKEFSHPTRKGFTAFLYMIEGEGQIAGTRVANRDLALLTDGDELTFYAGDRSARFLFLSGKPLREPIAWRGPIVMNSQEERDLAFSELQAGTFIKHS